MTAVARKVTKVALSHQKFCKAQLVTQELSSLSSEVGMMEFRERLSVLEQLRDSWKAGGNAVVHSIEVISGDHGTDIPSEQDGDIDLRSSVAEQNCLTEEMCTSELPAVFDNTSTNQSNSNLDENSGSELGTVVLFLEAPPHVCIETTYSMRMCHDNTAQDKAECCISIQCTSNRILR